jgi:endonuclease/exonuclease/phosphatase family metal-dependent hydrolase
MADLRFCARARTLSAPVLLVTVLVSALLAGCTGSSSDTSASRAPSEAPRMPLSLLVFNVEYGGTPSTDHVIADLHADVVGVLESYNRLPEIAQRAGYPYYDVGLQILSKYPILEPSGANGLYAYIEVAPGQAVALINTHLDYVQDGPNQLARGVSVADVLATEKKVRLSSFQKLLPSATHLLGQGWPVLLTGDLNEPSHLDWTAQTAAQHGGTGAVPWPVSEAAMRAGLHDAYRTVHPNPVTDPGNTWGGVAGSHGSPRRIDFAYVGGPVDVTSSEVVGEHGGDSVDRAYPKWTSDHRAVFSRLQVSPVPLPTTVALSSRMLTVGDVVTVTYQMPSGTDQGQVVLSGPAHASYDVTGRSGTVKVPTRDLAAGAYRVDLVGDSGDVIARNDLYVRPKDAHVHLSTDASTYKPGQPIKVSWSDGPANRWDWIGVYRAGAANPHKDDYLVWGYTGGHDAGALPPSTDGELTLGRDHQGAPWPLPPGNYVVRYLLTDQYNSVGSVPFTVR